MDFLKKHSKLFLGIFILFFILYVLPNFINLNGQKSYIEKKIEETIGFKATIKGDISFAIIPRPSLILRNVEIKSKNISSEEKEVKSTPVFINAPQILINTSLLNLFSKELVINKIGMVDSIFYANAYKNSKYENLESFLNGKTFKEVVVRDGTIALEQSFIHNINMNFSTIQDGKIKGNGDFSYEDGDVEDLSLLISYLDKDNYNIVSKFIFETDASELENDLTFIVKEGETTFSGITELDTDNLSSFIKKFNKDIEFPTTDFFTDDLKMKVRIQNSPDALLFNDGIFEGDEVVGKFKGKIPFEKNGELKIIKENITFDINFTNLSVNKVIELKKDAFFNPIDVLATSKNLLSFFKYGNFNITAKNMILKKGLITNFNLNTSPIYYDNKFNGIDIKKFNYTIGKNNMNIVGKILNIPTDITLDIKVNTTLPINISNIFTKKLILNSFNSNISMTKNLINLTNMKVKVGNNDIEGSFSINKKDGKQDYIVNLKSDKFDIDNFINEEINLAFILSKLSLLKNSNFSLNTMIKSLNMNKKNYDLFKLNTSFTNGNLKLKNLSFTSQGYQSKMSGDLLNILGSNGEFKNFDYKISSDTLKGISIPFVRNSFIEKMIANGVNKIDIHLNGPAINPNSEVDAILNKIKIKVNGKLLDSASSYTIELSHDELKGFLFSWGYIGDNLMNYFYDNIPFSVKAKIEGENIKDMELKIKDNVINGEILRKKTKNDFETSIILNTDSFDIKGIIKRIKDTDGYIDLLLKIIRGIPYNFTLTTPIFKEYDGNNYTDFKLDLQNAKNPGRFIFNMKKGDYKISIDSEILNSNIFEGQIYISDYSIPSNIMQNELLNLISGSLNAIIKFKTNGTNAYQLLSNLTGDYQTTIMHGVIQGISDYTTLFVNIAKLANITTNNVIYTIENSVKSGKLNFNELSISGKITQADVENSAFKLSSPNIGISGVISGNLIQKSLNIESVFDIRNLAPEPLVFMYNLKGFINNLSGEVDTSTILSKINTVYLQRKKKEILE